MIFEMPTALQSPVEELVRLSEQDAQRKAEKKRFSLGYTSQELDGLYADSESLTNEQASEWADIQNYTPPATESANPAPLSTLTERWDEFLPTCINAIKNDLSRRPEYRKFISEIFDRGQLASWVADTGTSGLSHQQLIDLNSRPVFVKKGIDVKAQADHLEEAVVGGAHIQSLPPMIYMQIQSSAVHGTEQFIGYMPFLEKFVPLHDIMRIQAGLVEGHSRPAESAKKAKEDGLLPRSEKECQMVFDAVARELSEFLTTPPKVKEQISLREKLLERFEDRFSESHSTPILLGKGTYAEMATFVHKSVSDLIGNDRSSMIGLGHGDLNATNIMVALFRDKSGKLKEENILVRFIDANPEKRAYDAVIEISRLLHWIELGVLLRTGHSTTTDAVRVRFPNCRSRDDFFSAVPRFEVVQHKLAGLPEVYQMFVRSLKSNVKFLEDPKYKANIKMPLGIAMYHFIAARYWPRNVDRLAAFLSAVTELRRLQDPYHYDNECGSDLLRRIRIKEFSSRANSPSRTKVEQR